MAKIGKEFKLPKPRYVDDGYVFLPVVRVGRVVPWGYVQCEKDPDILLPVEHELDLLEKAKDFLKQYSYRDVANWLSTETGRYISHVGLNTRVKSEQKRSTELANWRYLTRRYKEAADKALRIHETSLGRRGERGSEDGTSDS